MSLSAHVLGKKARATLRQATIEAEAARAAYKHAMEVGTMEAWEVAIERAGRVIQTQTLRAFTSRRTGVAMLALWEADAKRADAQAQFWSDRLATATRKGFQAKAAALGDLPEPLDLDLSSLTLGTGDA